MTTANQITISQKNTRLVVLFVLLLLSSVGMFGQEAAPVAASTITTENTLTADDTVTTTSATTESNSNINTVSWFMGSKQTPRTQGSMNSKKQMINSGIAPNRLLIKIFLKKAASFQSAVA